MTFTVSLSHASNQEVAQQANSDFDLLFLDADRQQYLGWWASIQRVVVPRRAKALATIDPAPQDAYAVR